MSEKIDEKTIDNELLLKRKIEKYYELDKYDKEIIENIATSDELTKKVMKHIEEEEKRTNYNISEKNMCEIIKLVGYHYDSMMKIQNAKDKPLNAIKGHNEPNDKITITKVEAKDRKKNKKRNKVSIFGKIKSVFEKR